MSHTSNQSNTQKPAETLALAACSAIDLVRAFNRWRRGDNGESTLPASPYEIGVAIDEVIRLASQTRCLRAQLQGIKARIEDGDYFGRTNPRGAAKELAEIADVAHRALECAAGIGRRMPNTGDLPRLKRTTETTQSNEHH